MQVHCYSDKGLVVKGATAEQAESIRAALGAAVVTGYNAKLGGWVFSRKREDRIRELVAGMMSPVTDDMPGEWMDMVLSRPAAMSTSPRE